MWVVIFIAGAIVLFMSALMIAYFNLRDTVETMKTIINLQNKRYEKVLSLIDQVIELNKQLYSDLYDDKDNDDNEEDYNNEEDDNNECE